MLKQIMELEEDEGPYSKSIIFNNIFEVIYLFLYNIFILVYIYRVLVL
jgi:hypothetical protein